MKRDAMPGGAPLTAAKKRPCKYGPRDAEGRCPKAPRSATKRPCKYGPRDAEGRCPKAPRKSAAKAPASSSILDKPIPQGTTASGRKRAPTTIRKEAAKVAQVAVSATVNEAAKRTYEAYREDPVKFKGAAKDLLSMLGRAAVPVAVILGALKLGLTWGRQAKATQDAAVERLAFDTLSAVKSQLLPRGQWKPEFSAKLLPQYRSFFRAQLVRINQSGGK